jgi:predicted amidohydrolase YtcJ
LLVTNATVRTLDPARPLAEAVAIAGNRIVAVGRTRDLAKLAGRRTRVIDARKQLVLPGFNDAHVHFLLGGFSLTEVDLRTAATPEEFSQRIAAQAEQQPAGAWILGGSWDHENWPGAALPTKLWIDVATPGHPVFVRRLDAHMALANSLALKRAGITRRTKAPPGGEIVRDARGEPTGLLKDAAMRLVERVIPPPSFAEKLAAARAASKHAAALGVTSVQDMLANDDVGVFQALLARGELKTRLYACRTITQWEQSVRHLNSALNLTQLGLGESGKQIESEIKRKQPGADRELNTRAGDLLRVGAVKGFADGSLGSATARFFQPYADQPQNRGLWFDEMLPEGAMLERALGADRAGLQIILHAIGDEANAAVLDLYCEVARQNGPRDRRSRIEHAQHLRARDIPRFARQRVIASVQPYHAVDDGRWCEPRIGKRRARTAYAFRSLLDAGATLALGTDWTVAPLNPLLTLAAAVTRQTLDGKHPEGWFPAQRLTVAEAIHAYTVGSAFAEFAETEKGTLTPGKLADLVLLERDLFHVPPEEIASIRVRLTVTDGRVVFEDG